MACRSGCATQDHGSWGECARASRLQLGVAVMNSAGAQHNRAWDKELEDYGAARKQGIQPAGTKQHQIDAAVRRSDETGVAFDAAPAPLPVLA